MINRRFKDYFDKNKLNNKEHDELINLKQEIFKALDAKNLNEANKLREELIAKIIQKISLQTNYYGSSSSLTIKN